MIKHVCMIHANLHQKKNGALAGLEKHILPLFKKINSLHTAEAQLYLHLGSVQRFNPTPSSSDNNTQAISGKSCC